MSKSTYLQKEELEVIQNMNSDFTKLKIALADAELQKLQIMKSIDQLKSGFALHEKNLIEKYGVNSVINVQTGEVTAATVN